MSMNMSYTLRYWDPHSIASTKRHLCKLSFIFVVHDLAHAILHCCWQFGAPGYSPELSTLHPKPTYMMYWAISNRKGTYGCIGFRISPLKRGGQLKEAHSIMQPRFFCIYAFRIQGFWGFQICWASVQRV